MRAVIKPTGAMDEDTRRREAAVDRFTIGAFQIHRVEEWSGPFLSPRALFTSCDPAEQIDDTEFNEIPIEAFIQSWVLKTPTRAILLDTGCGNHKDRPGIPMFGDLSTDFLDRLASAGFAPEDIDLVVCTHLHVDHVGWNTRRTGDRWVPTFPNARYVFPRDDVEYWDPCNRDRFPAMKGAAVNAGFFEDSVRPILEAGLADLVSGVADLGEGISLDPAPGHTPGSQALTIANNGACAMFVGDVVHHPVQIRYPLLNSIFCEDAARARATRLSVLARAADTDAILIPAHFGHEHVVRVERDSIGFKPVPAFA